MRERPEPTPSSTPRQRRKRRQRVQQFRCCGCVALALLAGLLLAVFGQNLRQYLHRRAQDHAARDYLFPLQLTTEGRTFRRYELVPLVMRLRDSEGRLVGPVADPPVITVWYQDQPIATIANLRKLVPRWRPATRDYAVNWPVPWMAHGGKYVFQARLRIDQPEKWRWPEQESPARVLPGNDTKPDPPQGETYCTAVATIEVEPRRPPDFPPGTCFATWEADFPEGTVTRPDGGKSDWRALFDWCRFMGADALLFRGAYTSTAGGPLTAEQPFVRRNLDAIPRLAAEAHRQGLKFGAWAVAYETYPYENNRGKPPYQFAQDISRTTGAVKALDFISLLDQRRRDDLAGFARQMQADPNVDYVGLDYMRSDVGGWEMTKAFTSDMPVTLPKNWGSLSQKQRWLFMAKKIEEEWQTDREFYEMWNWWRAHIGAQNAEYILRQAQLTKPLFIFVLSWMHGVQHGQDPVMFNDAGVGFLLPMLYQVRDQEAYEYLIRAWQEYMRAGEVNLAPGDQLDDYWHQGHKGRVPAQPELLYLRMRQAQKRMVPGGRPQGAFFHDISRAIGGNRGPYPGSEWALAGAAAFSQLRQDWGVYPVSCSLTCPKSATFGEDLQPRVTVQNVSKTTIRGLTIRLERTAGVRSAGTGRREVDSLGPGEKLEVPLSAVVDKPDGTRSNRFMICARVDWPAREYGEKYRADLPPTFVLMQYAQLSAGRR